jgi:F0F1-type ATP synthase membrane subunit c/vacuolar-type H+-ATPase subunit K
MLLMEAFAEISLIFSFILGIFIRIKITSALSMPEAIKLVAVSLTLSLATVGIAIGQAMLARTNIAAVGLNQNMYGKIATFTFMTSAFIETPLFFAFFIAIKMLYTPTEGINEIEALSFFGATLSSGLGSFGPAIGAAYISGKGIVEATLDPSQYDSLRKITAGGQFVLESGAAYALIISLMILSSIN